MLRDAAEAAGGLGREPRENPRRHCIAEPGSLAASDTGGGAGLRAFPGMTALGFSLNRREGTRMTQARARTIPLEGPAAVLDPADPGPFAAVAGSQFLGMDGDLAMYRDGDGHMGHAHPGWVVIRPEGSDVAAFCAPSRAVVEGG